MFQLSWRLAAVDAWLWRLTCVADWQTDFVENLGQKFLVRHGKYLIQLAKHWMNQN